VARNPWAIYHGTERAASSRNDARTLNLCFRMRADDSCRRVDRNRTCLSLLKRQVKSALEDKRILKLTGVPPLRNPPDFGVDERHVLVAGEAEVDEPLLVQRPRHLLQDRDPPRVVLDQVVIGREDRGDPLLNIQWRQAI
jgi:hypothetical protein